VRALSFGAVFVLLLVCGLLDLMPVVTIDLVDIVLLIVAGAIPSIVLAPAPVTRVVRTLMVVRIVVQDLLVVVAKILRFYRVDLMVFIAANTSLMRTTVRGYCVVILPAQSFVAGLLSTVVRALPWIVVFVVVLAWGLHVLAIGVLGIVLLIVAGAIPSIVLAPASPPVTRVILLVVRTLMVVPVRFAVQDLLVAVATILRFCRVALVVFSGAIPSLMRATARSLAVSQCGRPSVVEAMLSFSGVAPVVFAVTRRVVAVHRWPHGRFMRQAVLVVADNPVLVVNAVPSECTRLALSSIVHAFVGLARCLASVLQARGCYAEILRVFLRAGQVIQTALRHVVWSTMAILVPVIPGCAATAVRRVCHRNEDPRQDLPSDASAALC
jgi:hypothetical protein